jgi:hypothetical protein
MKICTLKFLGCYQAQRVHGSKEEAKESTERRLNWMSWNSSHSVGWTDASNSTFVGWVRRPKISKETVGWTDGIGSSSSDDLGFGNSKGQSSTSSASDDPTLWPAVYPTLAFKSYRDVPKLLLQHRMNWRFKYNPVVHLTPAFKLHSTAPSGCSSAPDGPTGCRCIASVHWLSHLVQRLFQRLWVTRWSDACAGGNHRFIQRYYFSGKLFQRLVSLARPINMTPLPLLSCDRDRYKRGPRDGPIFTTVGFVTR